MNPDVKSFSIVKDPKDFIKEENLEKFNLIIINELEEVTKTHKKYNYKIPLLAFRIWLLILAKFVNKRT